MSSSIGLIWHNLSWPGVLHGGLFVMSLQCKYLVRNSDRALVIISRIDGNQKGHFWLNAREYVGISLWKKTMQIPKNVFISGTPTFFHFGSGFVDIFQRKNLFHPLFSRTNCHLRTERRNQVRFLLFQG